MRTGHFPAAVVAGTVALLVGGCDTAEVKRLNDPNAYLTRANASMADIDVANRLQSVLESRHGDVNSAMRVAMRANRRVLPAKSPGFIPVFSPPREPTGAVVYVSVLIDATGAPSDLVCEAASAHTLEAPQLAYVESTVRSWKFVPTTIDGKPVPCIDTFRVETDGASFVRCLPRTR